MLYGHPQPVVMGFLVVTYLSFSMTRPISMANFIEALRLVTHLEIEYCFTCDYSIFITIVCSPYIMILKY